MSNSNPPSGTSTPTPRFASSGHTAEDLLKEQTVGLVHLSDFRKRRAEALEQTGSSVGASGNGSGASTPGSASRYVVSLGARRVASSHWIQGLMDQVQRADAQTGRFQETEEGGEEDWAFVWG
jgi:hypothetical protein